MLEEGAVLFWISCALAGVSLCLTMQVLTRPVAAPLPESQRLSGPGSGRWLLKLVWPWVSALAQACGPFLSWRLRQSLARRIQIAGLDMLCKPEHIFAIQWLVFLALVAGSGLIAWLYFSVTPFAALLYALPLGPVGLWWPARWLHERGMVRQRQMLKEFPFLLDMTTLCVEAGLNLQGALQQAAQHGPEGPLRHELRHALADMRAGMPRLDALRQMAQRTGLPAMQQLATALGQADQLGMSLGPLLRAQSEQRRSERFLRAEKLALEAPVKMLFPMVVCIFPCTFLVIGFPLAVKLFGAQW
ncbi:Type II secretion system protein F (GspF) OS=Eoetvoesiella caeni OX=645616 GN=DFR37_103327 PE=4 SV=1 [Eoetvoesiella caeni]